MTTKQERLKQVYDHLRTHFGIHTQIDFAEAIRITRPALSSAMNGNEAYLTKNLFQKICAAYPGVFDLNYLLTGKGSLLTIEEEIKNEDIEKTYHPAPSQIDLSSLVNALLAKSDEAIASLKREIAAKDEVIQAKDDRIADLEKLAEERLHRIAELRRIIDANQFGLPDYPFAPGVADKPKNNHKRI